MSADRRGRPTVIEHVYSAAGRHRVTRCDFRYLHVEVWGDRDYPLRVRLDREIEIRGTIEHRGITYSVRELGGSGPTPAPRLVPAAATSGPLSVLGLAWGASHAEIRRAFRLLAHQHHPDAGGDAERFRVLRAAYEAAIAG